jgi:hypothetical protein
LHVRYDPEDLSQVWVYEDPMLERFVCRAERADRLSAADLALVAAKAKAAFKPHQERVVELRRQGRRLARKIEENPGILIDQGEKIQALVRSETASLNNAVGEAIRATTKPTYSDEELAEAREYARFHMAKEEQLRKQQLAEQEPNWTEILHHLILDWKEVQRPPVEPAVAKRLLRFVQRPGGSAVLMDLLEYHPRQEFLGYLTEMAPREDVI